jgi:methylmalonyl-CoA mutase
MMGDIQEYFVDHKVRNFYSVSISGYHIAEAGANPISQLAFTLANGFTYRRGLPRARHAHRRLRAEPVVLLLQRHGPGVHGDRPRGPAHLGRAMRERYGANERSQKLKYHVQTSGRSLHAQEIAFNDIRTTLQALSRSTTTATACTPTPTTRRSPRPPRRACAARWRSS